MVGRAANHWDLWREDVRLLTELGVNSYRFSIEWSRIEPEPGKFDYTAMGRYLQLIDALLENDITPVVTLHHFTHPKWFHSLNPWHNPESVRSFVRFAETVTENILPRVPIVVTFNEPLVWLLAAYGDAKFPPGLTNLGQLMQGLHNMLAAHRETYDYIKARYPDKQVGIAHNFIVFKRAPNGIEADRRVKRLIHYFYNIMITRSFRKNRLRINFPLVLNYDEPIELDDHIDFWGVNYYYRLHVKFRLNLRRPFDLLSIPRSSGEGQSDLGWEIYPLGLAKVCRWLKSANKPIYVTENGIAANDDSMRIRFLESHLNVLQDLREDGFPIKGYFHWSFLDNYEWLEGTSAKFGLVGVDFEHGYERTLKPSGEFYRDYLTKELDSPENKG